MTGGSGITSNNVNEAIKLAKAKTNITGFVMDDFFIRGSQLTLDISQLDSIRVRIPRELGWSNPNLWVIICEIIKTSRIFNANQGKCRWIKCVFNWQRR